MFDLVIKNADVVRPGWCADVAPRHRIRTELPDWPSYRPEEAFADYAGWLEARDAPG